MPVLLDERILTLEFSDLLARKPIHRPASPPVRTKGVHQSGILAHIAHKIGKLKPGERPEEDAVYPLRWALGVMWEEFYFSLVPDVDWQPGEFTIDEISVNCDGIGTCSLPEIGLYDEPCVDETKCTEKKVRSGDEFMDEWLYQHQGRAYCHCYGPEIVRWTILYYRGDWAGSGPICKQYVVRFTPTEIRQTWAMLVKHRDQVEPEY